jgi:AcrR family transcriptional regulator
VSPVPRQRTQRAEQTRALIVDTALHLFTEHGYEAATMRAIAAKAGIATGNAYYYFASKEELAGEFYDRAVTQQEQACRSLLDTETGLSPRLRGVLRALVEVQAPYRALASALRERAMVPSPARDRAVALYAEVADGTRTRMATGVRERLPGILWLYSLGIGQFWAQDTSPGCQRTLDLIDATTPLAERVVRLSRYPLLRAFTRDLVAVATVLAPDGAVPDVSPTSGG